ASAMPGETPKVSDPVLLGQAILHADKLPESVLTLGWVQVAQLPDPRASAALRQALLQRPEGPTLDYLVQEMADGRVDLPLLRAVLAHRHELVLRSGPRLRELAARGGVLLGLVGALEDDGSALNGGDAAAQRALLICAVDTRLSLPTD